MTTPTFETMKRLIVKDYELEPERLTPETPLADIELDSLAVTELIFALEPYYALVAETFDDAPRGQLLLYEDSYGAYAIAISGGDAYALTGAGPGDRVRIRRAYA